MKQVLPIEAADTPARRPPDVFRHFDDIRIINLRHRADRRSEVFAELRRVGLADDPRVRIFDAVAPDDAGTFTSKGARGCFLSQLALLEHAATHGRSILILEDDVDFTTAIWQFMMPQHWEIFYGGYHAANAEDLENSDIAGSHCMGFSAAAATRLAPYLRNLLDVTDHPPIDGAYVWFRRSHDDVMTVFAKPAIAEQRSSRTDIATPPWFDRTPGLREAAGLARRAMRTIQRRVLERPSQ